MTHTLQDEPAELRYLDDLKVGERFLTGTHALDEKQIIEFAKQFDPQPFHLDDQAAKRTMFGGLAASGWHTAAISMQLQVTGSLQLAGGMIGAGVELSWPTPTRAGDILQAESEIEDIRISKSKPDRGIVTVRTLTRNQHGQILQDARAKMIVPCRPAEIAASSKKTENFPLYIEGLSLSDEILKDRETGR